MATTYSSRFYNSDGTVKPGFPFGTKGFHSLEEFNETIATTVTDGLDEHYMMPADADGKRLLEGYWIGHGSMDSGATPTLDADIVLRTVLNGATTNTMIHDSSAVGLFSLPGGISAQEILASGPPKAGATAGWSVNAGANLSESTLPASQTGSTLVVPIYGLKVGDTISGFKVSAQIESAGGTVTVDADLRKMTNAAADPTDASVGAITQVSVTADTAVAAAKTGLTEVVAFGEWFYVLITATTAASTDIRFLGISVTVQRPNETTNYLRWVSKRLLIPAADSGYGDFVFSVGAAGATPAAANLTFIPVWY